MFCGAAEYDINSMPEIPLWPAESFSQKESTPIPNGLMTPIPVITTRRGEFSLLVIIRGFEKQIQDLVCRRSETVDAQHNGD